jgi:phospholipase C
MNVRAIGMWLVVGVLGSTLAVQAASVTLAWDPPDPSTEITGYKIYYGPADTPSPDWYTKVVDVHTVTQYTVEGLTAGIWYVFAVQAYGDDGKTSDFSNQVRHLAAAIESIASSPQVVAVDSEETTAHESGSGRNVLDGDPATIWHTKWFGQSPPHPHHIILDLGAVRTVYGIRYLPRQDGKLNGTIVGYEVYVSLNRDTWAATPWMRGSWDPTAAAKIEVRSNGQRGRCLKLVAMSAADNRPWTSAAEIQIIGEFP